MGESTQDVGRLPSVIWPVDSCPFLQQTHTAKQKNFLELNEDNLSDAFQSAWSKEVRWTNSYDDIVLQVFIYLAALASATLAI